MIKKINCGRFVASFGAISFLVVLVIGIYAGLGGTTKVDGSHVLTEGWKVTINHQVYEEINLEKFRFPLVQKGDVVVMERYLPDKLADGAVMQFYSTHSAIKVSVEEETIYEYGFDYMQEGRLLGYGYNFVTLPEQAEQKLIKITFVVAEKNAFGNLYVPVIESGSNLIRNFVIERREPLAIVFFLIIFGLIFVFATVFFSFDGPDFYRLLCIAFFSLSMGMWNLCSYDLISLLTYDMQMKALIEFSAIYGAPTFIFAYFYEQAYNNTNSKIQKILYLVILGIQVCFVATASICQMFKIIHFPALLSYSHVILGIMLVYIIFIFIRTPWEKQKENLVLLSGVVIMAVIVAWDLLRYNIQLYIGGFEGGHFKNYTYLGTFAFVMAMIIDFIRKISSSLYVSAKNETLERFAYTDELTGLFNRRRCEEIYDEIDKNPSDYVLMALDLNHLKRVNDQLGHDVGDAYIREFGHMLHQLFEKQDVIRIGGDEFIVVVREAANIDMDQKIEEMLTKIKEINQIHPGWNMSTAYGVVYAREDRERTIREANKIADERMYEKKFEMKGIKRK